MSSALELGFVIAPGVTQLDFTGAMQVLNPLPGARKHLVAATLDPVPTDCGFAVVPTTAFADCPKLDLVLVPGGSGRYIAQAVADDALLDFLAKAAGEARYVTSVCTGALILGAAGLLKGRRATTHWAYHDELARVGAIPVEARVVRDGNLFTAGGVTAGVDFGLVIAAELAGETTARTLQLINEYDPDPPFDGGRPERASPEMLAVIEKRMAGVREPMREALDRALARRAP
jgi:cyclohexyl-isocyanide hydratase